MKKMANYRPKWPELDQIFSKNQSHRLELAY